MITEWFGSLVVQFLDWLATVFGPWTPPTELTDAVSAVNGLIASFSSVGVWVDWTVLGSCVVASIGVWVVVVGIKIVRAVVAHIPAFGGAGD
ncbi:hypothetical protein [Microbacterium sp. 4NA327F11]|uniref:hypothetical protein n=1 Tax=Microbacterium sp. 4NA327F11 TaxID=2502229 RepID=UPI0010F5DF21|nr:hypothetical protein [Microbacterium sp. 4NA327F11]